MKTSFGFTIIEMMMAILVLAILATVAAPSFSNILKQNRLATQANTILASVNYARSQTVNLNASVDIAPIVAGTDWSAGWTVTAGGEVRNFESIENATLISSLATITYLADGSISSGGVVTLTVRPTDCPTGDPDVRVITIRPSGQARSAPANC